jgi:hypothetical protein
MARFIYRAMDWRHRAEELRATAEKMLTPAARTSLLEMAAALEHHATNLEQTADKFARAPQTATETVRFRRSPWQHRSADRRRGGN